MLLPRFPRWLWSERSVHALPVFGWALNLVALFVSEALTDNLGFFFFFDR